MRLALYQPDIPQNAGSLIRLGACLDVAVDIIEPCGFLFGAAQFRRAGMDYLEMASLRRHPTWEAFAATWAGARLVVLTAHAAHAYTDFAFMADDIILLGRESAGLPPAVHACAVARLRIPLKTGLRSVNVAQAGAMALGEALRQTKGFPR